MLITSFEMDAKRSGMQEGIELGIQQGMQQGIAQGVKQGMQQGIYKEKENIVLKMVSRGLDIQTISEYTDLDISEVKKIKENSSCH